MHRDIIQHLPVILAVANRRGFAAAAAELGMGPSAVSHAVKTVEDRLQTTLFARTTRSVSLTEDGEAFIAVIRPAMADILESMERLHANSGRISGTLRVNTPRVALSIALTPVLSELAKRHPDLTVEVATNDGLVDIAAEGFDAGIRLGEMIAQDMIAVRLTPPFKAILVASPDYLSTKGEPETIDVLGDHNCIGFRLVTTGAIYGWELNRSGVEVAVDVSGTVLVTDATYARDLALAGVGIAYIFEPLVRADLDAGRLRQVVSDSAIEEPGLFLYFPARIARLPKMRAFIDTAREVLHQRN